MKVLEEGEDVEWERKIECLHCKSKILVISEDVIYNPSDSNGDEEYYVDCHGHKIIIAKGCESNLNCYANVTDTPKHVREVARDRYFDSKEREEKEEKEEREEKKN